MPYQYDGPITYDDPLVSYDGVSLRPPIKQPCYVARRRIEEPIGQVRYNLADGTGKVTFETYNRRTAQVVGTRPVDLLSRDLISIFFGAARAAGLVPAQ